MYIIAEIGTAHNGSIAQAKELIDAATEAGADCVKFQWVYADEILHPQTGYVSLPGGNVRLYDRFKELEVAPAFYAELRRYAAGRHTGFICSPFGIRSLQELWDIRPDAVKIASPELNYCQLLKQLASLETAAAGSVPVLLSSGVSLLADIEKALILLDVCRQAAPGDQHRLPPLTLLHCVTSYPAPETEYNLRVLQSLHRIFGIPVGVSDHSLDPILVPALSVVCGGSVIEKHITLSKSGNGLDDPVALVPSQFRQMADFVKNTEQLLQSENADAALAVIAERFGAEKTAAVLGSGIKKLAPSEYENYRRTNRSVHVLHDMQTGDILSEADIAVLRTEKILKPGIAPEYAETVVGARLTKDIPAGEGLQWSDVISCAQAKC